MAEVHYLISDASKQVDVESHVLRYWEDELELDIPRNDMGHRYYTEYHIRLFRQIKELKEKGYQLKAIKSALNKMAGVMEHVTITEDYMEEDMKAAWNEGPRRERAGKEGAGKEKRADGQARETAQAREGAASPGEAQRSMGKNGGKEGNGAGAKAEKAGETGKPQAVRPPEPSLGLQSVRMSGASPNQRGSGRAAATAKGISAKPSEPSINLQDVQTFMDLQVSGPSGAFPNQQAAEMPGAAMRELPAGSSEPSGNQRTAGRPGSSMKKQAAEPPKSSMNLQFAKLPETFPNQQAAEMPGAAMKEPPVGSSGPSRNQRTAGQPGTSRNQPMAGRSETARKPQNAEPPEAAARPQSAERPKSSMGLQVVELSEAFSNQQASGLSEPPVNQRSAEISEISMKQRGGGGSGSSVNQQASGVSDSSINQPAIEMPGNSMRPRAVRPTEKPINIQGAQISGVPLRLQVEEPSKEPAKIHIVEHYREQPVPQTAALQRNAAPGPLGRHGEISLREQGAGPGKGRGAEIDADKMARLQSIMNHMVGQAMDANMARLVREVSTTVSEDVTDKVTKEVEYLMRVSDEKEEERFRQLDETIRAYQKQGKGRAEAAATKLPFFKKKKFGKNGNKLFDAGLGNFP